MARSKRGLGKGERKRWQTPPRYPFRGHLLDASAEPTHTLHDSETCLKAPASWIKPYCVGFYCSCYQLHLVWHEPDAFHPGNKALGLLPASETANRSWAVGRCPVKPKTLAQLIDVAHTVLPFCYFRPVIFLWTGLKFESFISCLLKRAGSIMAQLQKGSKAIAPTPNHGLQPCGLIPVHHCLWSIMVAFPLSSFFLCDDAWSPERSRLYITGNVKWSAGYSLNLSGGKGCRGLLHGPFIVCKAGGKQSAKALICTLPIAHFNTYKFFIFCSRDFQHSLQNKRLASITTAASLNSLFKDLNR